MISSRIFCRRLLRPLLVDHHISSQKTVKYSQRVFGTPASDVKIIDIDERKEKVEYAAKLWTRDDLQECQPEVSLDLLQLTAREQRLAKMFQRHVFTDGQISKIIRFFRNEYALYEIDPKVVEESFKYWKKAIKHPDRDFMPGHGKTHQEVLSSSNNCQLLLINPEKMDKRIQCLRNLAFISGKDDLFTIFCFAPTAFFLQDWSDFCRKFFYLQHRVFEWMVDKHKDPFPVPHPLVSGAKCMALPYHTLKARFEFAIRTGTKSAKFIRKHNLRQVDIDFNILFLYELDDYLKVIAPSVTEEEFYVFEKFIQENPDEEDDMINEIVALNELGASAKNFVDPNISEADYHRLKKVQRKKAYNERLKSFPSGLPSYNIDEFLAHKDEELAEMLADDDGDEEEVAKTRQDRRKETIQHLASLTHLE